jgi:hypothetical protein
MFALTPGNVFWPYFAGAVILLIGLFATRKEVSLARGKEKLLIVGRVFFAVPMAVFAAQHFTTTKYGYLTTEKNYRDFDLRLKFKGEAAGNSGVFLHARIIGIDPQHGPDIEGMQVEVDPNLGKHTGGLYESGGRRWVMMPTEEGERTLKHGEWNDLEISARGNQVVTHLNGAKIADFTDASPKFTDGVIGLQIHTGGGVKMRWTDIFIREK